VLLDFWRHGVRRAEQSSQYRARIHQYHSDGFEILGISLDQANAKKISRLYGEQGMTWPEVYDAVTGCRNREALRSPGDSARALDRRRHGKSSPWRKFARRRTGTGHREALASKKKTVGAN